ncbi:MAG: KEOPS complex subunit Cgi121 [Methanomicrobiaceae archaeon]|nr:KEOPS complex subunit Cgi121 [Methanomicrobiaceae archaeon]
MKVDCDIAQARFSVDDEADFLAHIREIADRFGVRIVVFNAAHMAGNAHVTAALDHAQRSFFEESPIANSFEMESLLYAAGSRQVLDAVRFGIHSGDNAGYVCICPPSPGARDALRGLLRFVEEDWEDLDDAKKRRLMDLFGISREELATVGEGRLPELVRERVALLDVYR